MNHSTQSILTTLTLEQLRTLAREFNAPHIWPATKALAIENLDRCADAPAILERLSFEELSKVCRKLGVDRRAHRREVLVTRILDTLSQAPTHAAAG